MSQEILRSYPAAHMAEAALIQLAMENPAVVMPKLIMAVSQDDFHGPAHHVLYGLLEESYNTGRNIDPVSLQSLLMDRQLMEKIGGPGRIGEIVAGGASPGGLAGYLEDVKDKANRRRGIALAIKLEEAFRETAEPWLPAVEDVESMLMGLRSTTSRKGLRSGREVMVDLVNRMDSAFRHRGNPMGLSLGFPDIDRVVNGLQREDFVIVAARPAMGKTSLVTAFAEAIALDAANKTNRPVLMFTLEMADVQIMRRSVLGRARVALNKGKTGMFSAAEGMVWKVAQEVINTHRQADSAELAKQIAWAAIDALQDRWEKKSAANPGFTMTSRMIDDAKREIVDLSAAIAGIVVGSLTFYDGYGVSTQEIRAQVREWVRRIGWSPDNLKDQPPMVILDYLQLVKASGKKAQGDPRLSLMEACETLKGLAKELRIVVMALAQVGRGAEENPGRIPQLKDLKESGAIEEYADMVAFIHRDSYYKPWAKLDESKQEKWAEYAKARNDTKDAKTLREPTWDGESYYGAMATFAIRKMRDGALADIDILFRGEFAKFTPKTANLYSNKADERQQPTLHEDEF